MNRRKNIAILAGIILSVSLFAVSLTALLMSCYYQRTYTQILGKICREIIEEQPEAEGAVLSALKECRDVPAVSADENTLLLYGYRRGDFVRSAGKYGILFSVEHTPPGGMKKIFCVEALVTAGKPVLITLPVTAAVVAAFLKMSYLEPMLFIREAPFLPILVFMLAIFGFVALAYYLGAKKIMESSLAETLRDDTVV